MFGQYICYSRYNLFLNILLINQLYTMIMFDATSVFAISALRNCGKNMHIQKGELNSITCGISDSLHYCECFIVLVDMKVYAGCNML